MTEKFISCYDNKLKLAHAEALIDTDYSQAIKQMLDIFENALNTTDHDVIDSIDL